MDGTQITTRNELNKENEFTLFRASEISTLLNTSSGPTIGPNSTALDLKCSFEDLSIDKPDIKRKSVDREKSLEKSKRRSEPSRPLDVSDILYIQDKIRQESELRRINAQTLKLLEERQLREKEKYQKIQDDLEKLRLDAERRHREKMEALERQIQHELKLENEREQQYLKQRTELAANSRKILEEQEKQLEQIRAQIKKIEETFIKLEAIFLNTLQSCPSEMSEITDAFTKQHKDLRNLKESSKNSLDGSKTALKKLDALVQNLTKSKNDFEAAQKARAEQLKKEEEEKAAKAAKEAAVAREAAANVVPTPIVLVQPHQAVNQVVDAEERSDSKQKFTAYKQLLASLKNETKLLEETPGLQQVRFALKLVINNAINLLNEKNKTTLIDGHKKLINLLTGQRCPTSKGDVAVTDHIQAATWCRLKIAEKLIDRCEKDPNITFYVAALTIAIWQQFPEFGEIFKAVLYKECPFLIPYKPPMINNMSNEEFLQSWGFRMNENGTCEDHTYYESRTTKFAGLLAALWITNSKTGSGPNPYGIENAWKYLALVFNNPPDTNYLHILGKVLEITGSALHQAYGKQFIKIMLFLRDKYIPAVQQSVDEETSAPFNRLRDAVLKFFTEGKFVEPKGKLMVGYW